MSARPVSTRPIRIGIIGCGEIAQIMHLPYLHELSQFRVEAICDMSSAVLTGIGDAYAVHRRYTDYRDLIADGGLDAVAICTQDHAEIAEAAAHAGLHLFVEKPLAFSPAQAESIIAAAHENRVQLMVGYMKRYDAAYEYGAHLMRAMNHIRLIRLHDFAGEFDAHLPLYTLVRPSDLPEEERTKAAEAAERTLRDALGREAEEHWELYLSMLTLCTHDASVLQGIFGQPDAIVCSERIGEKGLMSLLDYGPRGKCIFEADSQSELIGWDEEICVYGRRQIISITFPNPFVKHAETIVRVSENRDRVPRIVTTPVSYEEAFRREWLHFASCLWEGLAPRTDGEGARADIEVLAAIVRSLPARTATPA